MKGVILDYVFRLIASELYTRYTPDFPGLVYDYKIRIISDPFSSETISFNHDGEEGDGILCLPKEIAEGFKTLGTEVLERYLHGHVDHRDKPKSFEGDNVFIEHGYIEDDKLYLNFYSRMRDKNVCYRELEGVDKCSTTFPRYTCGCNAMCSVHAFSDCPMCREGEIEIQGSRKKKLKV
jgi:hypothetical protein